MKGRSLLAIAGLIIAGTFGAGAPASAAPLDKGHFDDVFTEFFDCDSITPAIPTRQDNDVHVNFLLNQRGGPNVFLTTVRARPAPSSSPISKTGGTYTDVFSANSRDHKIVDNGDGTINIFVQGSGVDRWYDTNGRLVLVDSGNFRYSIDIDYNGTPSDVTDDEELPDSSEYPRLQWQ